MCNRWKRQAVWEYPCAKAPRDYGNIPIQPSSLLCGVDAQPFQYQLKCRWPQLSQRCHAAATHSDRWVQPSKGCVGREQRLQTAIPKPFLPEHFPFYHFHNPCFLTSLAERFSIKPVKTFESQGLPNQWEEPLHSEAIAFQLPGEAGPREAANATATCSTRWVILNYLYVAFRRALVS